MQRRIMFGAACAVALATVAVASPAAAWSRGGHDGPDLSLEPVATLADGLVSPLSLDISRRGTAYLSQNFVGVLNSVPEGGSLETLATASLPGGEIGAVSSRHGTVYFADNDQPNGVDNLMSLSPGGSPEFLADLHEYELTANPDQENHYGFVGLDEACAAQLDPAGLVLPDYTGIVDSHPYASLALHDGIYVADAGGNDIVRVDYDGDVETVAVLPPQLPVTATAELVAAQGLPECVTGHGYVFEPVPTDVEEGPHGWLYVSTLPGGPEDPSFGGRGSVYAVNPDSGEVKLVATGFTGSTNLAVDRESGIILVAELFGGDGTGQISAVSPSGDVLATFAVPSPAAIELRDGKVYATTNAFVPDATGAPQPIGELTVWNLTDNSHGHHSWGDDGKNWDED
jgi:hypothetical protein